MAGTLVTGRRAVMMKICAVEAKRVVELRPDFFQGYEAERQAIGRDL